MKRLTGGLFGLLVVCTALILMGLRSGYFLYSVDFERNARLIIASKVLQLGGSQGICLVRFDVVDLDTDDLSNLGFAICRSFSMMHSPRELGANADTFALWSGRIVRVRKSLRKVGLDREVLKTPSFPYGEEDGVLLARSVSDARPGSEYRLYGTIGDDLPFGPYLGISGSLLGFDGEKALFRNRRSEDVEVLSVMRTSQSAERVFRIRNHVVFVDVDCRGRELVFLRDGDEYLLSGDRLFRLNRADSDDILRLAADYYWWIQGRRVFVKLRDTSRRVSSVAARGTPLFVLPVDRLSSGVSLTGEVEVSPEWFVYLEGEESN